jgi:ribonucleoside-triphosphate reductase
MTGGTVAHLYLGKSITKEQAKSIVKTACENYRLPYISLSPLIRQCEDHGFIDTATDTCPHCGKPLNYKQKITGYIRDVSNFNPGKLAEFKDRKQVIL